MLAAEIGAVDSDADEAMSSEEEEEDCDLYSDDDFVPIGVQEEEDGNTNEPTNADLIADMQEAIRQLAPFTSKSNLDAVSLNYDIVALRILTGHLPKVLRTCWQLSTSDHFQIKIKVNRKNFRHAILLPTASIMLKNGSVEVGSNVITEKLLRLTNDYLEKNYRNEQGNGSASFFADLYRSLFERLPTLNKHCILCDDEIPDFHGVLPTFCDTKELCNFQFSRDQQNNRDVSCTVSPGVLGVLRDFLYEANLTTTRDADVGRLPIFGETTQLEEKDYLNKLLTSLPEMEVFEDEEVFKVFCETNPQHSLLLQWLVRRRGCHLELLDRNDLLMSIHSNDQFLLVADDAESLKNFEKLKRENHYRSKFLFHNCLFNEWHTMLRYGLPMNKYHGNGVRLYKRGDAETNAAIPHPLGRRAFMGNINMLQPYNHGHRSAGLNNEYNQCLLLCEVIDDGSLEERGDNSFFVYNPELVCPRLLVLFKGDPNRADDSDLKISAVDEMKLRSILARFLEDEQEPASTAPVPLQELPEEIIRETLLFLEPDEVARCERVNRFFFDFIQRYTKDMAKFEGDLQVKKGNVARRGESLRIEISAQRRHLVLELTEPHASDPPNGEIFDPNIPVLTIVKRKNEVAKSEGRQPYYYCRRVLATFLNRYETALKLLQNFQRRITFRSLGVSGLNDNMTTWLLKQLGTIQHLTFQEVQAKFDVEILNTTEVVSLTIQGQGITDDSLLMSLLYRLRSFKLLSSHTYDPRDWRLEDETLLQLPTTLEDFHVDGRLGHVTEEGVKGVIAQWRVGQRKIASWCIPLFDRHRNVGAAAPTVHPAKAFHTCTLLCEGERHSVVNREGTAALDLHCHNFNDDPFVYYEMPEVELVYRKL